MKNVTNEYASMIHAFSCDFDLANSPDSHFCLDDLQVRIEKKEKRILNDMKLLAKLSFGLRCGRIAILEVDPADMIQEETHHE